MTDVNISNILKTFEPSQCDVEARPVCQITSHLGFILAANNDDGYENEEGHKKTQHNGGPGLKNCYDY